MTLNAKKIIKEVEKDKALLKKLGVKRIGLFGSFAEGKQNKTSDIDILVSFKKASFDNYMDLKFHLEKKFKRPVDLVTETGLKENLNYVKKVAVYAKAN